MLRELFNIWFCTNSFTVDKITSSHPSRVTKSIASLFDSPNEKFILIEGAPGIGKSVLAKEIVYLWATHKLYVDKRVILLLARDPNLLKELARHEKLPKSIVIITSRPHATRSLGQLADKRIEILGFAKEERDEYISESLKMFPDKKTELEKYLKLQPIISSIIHVPLNLAILLYLIKEDCMPETLTELNVIHTIYRHLQKQHLKSSFLLNDNIEKITDLPKPVLTIVNQ